MARILVSLLLLLSLALPGMAMASETAGTDSVLELARPGDAPPAIPSGAPSPVAATTWFFAEGSTAAPFQTWLLFFNPTQVDASVSLVFMFPSGGPQTRNITVGANRRVSVFLNQILPNQPAVATQVNSSQPIFAERAMYFNLDGSVSFGAQAAQTQWLFAEGSTAVPHHTWFLVQNPGGVPATVTFTFFREGGGAAGSVTIGVGPTSRFSLFANQVIPGISFSTQVVSNQPVVVERSMYDSRTGGGHNVVGVNSGAAAWNFAEGATVAPFHTWFLLFNPNNFAVSILARLLPETAGPGPLLEFTLPPLSRTSVFANTIFPNRSFASLWLTNQPQNAPIVIERAMYFFKPNAGSHATVGATSRATTWWFAEGATAAPFDEWLLLSNPSQQAAANVTVTFFSTVDGTAVASRNFVVGDRTSIFVNQIVPNVANLSIRVTSDLPISAERSMYFRQGGTNTIGSPS